MRLVDAYEIGMQLVEMYNNTCDLKTKEALRAAMQIIAGAPTIASPCKWTRIEDSPPPHRGEYLVAYHPCYWDRVQEEEIRVGTDTFRGKKSWAKAKTQRVTRWMPLPEPPKEDEK